MKNFLFSFIFLAGISSLLTAQVCTPVPFPNPGIYPDTNINLHQGAVTQYYHTTITAVVPTDTVIGGFTATVDSIGVTNVYDLPTGFTWAANTNSGYFAGGTSGCIAITGTPVAGQEGTYPIRIRINAVGSLMGMPAQLPDTIYGYKIVIYDDTHVGIVDSRKFNFDVTGNFPNPAQQYTDITVTSKDDCFARITLMNMVGDNVVTDKFHIFPGENTYRLNTAGLNNGVYFYTIDNGSQKITKKIIVSR